MKEIERKFLVKELPDLSKIKPVKQERYYIKQELDKQVRIQRKDNSYEMESKNYLGPLQYEKVKQTISKDTFEMYKKGCQKGIFRDSYLICVKPIITIKQYHGDYEGFTRVEIEFDTLEQACTYNLPNWIGKEITNTPLGLDSELLKLNKKEFKKCLRELSGEENHE